MTDFERQQARRVFFHAGQTAFLIGVLPSANPYREPLPRAEWDKGYAKAKERYHFHFAAESKVAAWLGHAIPRREAAPRRSRPTHSRPHIPTSRGAFRVERSQK